MSKSALMQTMKAVAWSFFGVRKASDHDMARLKPLHVVVAGVLGAVLFVLALLLLVHFVIDSGIAA